MNEIRIGTQESLNEQRGLLQHKLSSAQEVLMNIANPGWINQRAPRASRLRIDVIPVLERFQNLETIGKIRLQLRDVVIPKYEEILASTNEIPDINLVIAGFDRRRVGDWPLKEDLVERGLLPENRGSFTREYMRLHRLWLEGKFPSLTTNDLVVYAAFATSFATR